MMTLLCAETHVGHILVLPSRRLVHPATYDDFVDASVAHIYRKYADLDRNTRTCGPGWGEFVQSD